MHTQFCVMPREHMIPALAWRHFLALKALLPMCARVRLPCPRTRELLGQLEDAFGSELLQDVDKASGVLAKKMRRRVRANRALQKSVLYHKTRRNELKEALVEATGSKDAGMLKTNWLVKVSLSTPLTTMRGYCQAFTDLFGEYKSSSVSRPAVIAIRDAFVTVLKGLNTEGATHRLQAFAAGERLLCSRDQADAASAAFLRDAFLAAPGADPAAAGAALAAAGAPLPAVGLIVGVDIHDEARMRLRTRKAAQESASRSRTAKVQTHDVCMFFGPARVKIYTELEGLADKTAPTLASSLLGVVDIMGNIVGSGLADAGGMDWWFVGVIIGDSVNTNQNAYRILWSEAQRSPPAGGRASFFLICVFCATHQANLSARHLIEGGGAKQGAINVQAAAGAPGAAEAARAAAGAKHAPCRTFCGTSVRLFKYLIGDYYEEFLAALVRWVDGGMKILGKHEVLFIALFIFLDFIS